MRDRLIFSGLLLFTLIVAAFLVVPAMLSISAGITVNYFRGIRSGVTLQWVVQVWDLYAGTILLSFVVAFATLAVTLAAGVPAAYALHVRGGRLSRIVEEIITLPLAIPGLAIALALLLTYGCFGDFRRSWLFILAGHVIFTMPFMVRSVMAVFATVDIKTLDEGAASLGVTGGTSTAYTVTSFQAFDSLAHVNGQTIAFTPHATVDVGTKLPDLLFKRRCVG